MHEEQLLARSYDLSGLDEVRLHPEAEALKA